MQDKRFVTELPHAHKIKAILFISISITVFALLGLVFSLNSFFLLEKLPWAGLVFNHIKENIATFTWSGVFYAHFIGGLFFVPSLDEVVFYYALVKNSLWLFIFIAAIAGYMLAQLVNYFVGMKMSDPIFSLVSKSKLYKARRYINKYGSFGIFIFNALPFPAPLLTFGLGIAKYNFSRLMLWTLIGKVVKYTIILVIVFYLR